MNKAGKRLILRKKTIKSTHKIELNLKVLMCIPYSTVCTDKGSQSASDEGKPYVRARKLAV